MPDPDTGLRSRCPINYALEIFGDRWTLLLLRDLILLGKEHYRELLASEEGIATNILADRLKRLEISGIITRERDPEDGRQFIYRTTEEGLALTPVLLEIAAWASVHDDDTAAPAGFAESFYADREAYYANHRELIAELIKRNQDAGE